LKCLVDSDDLSFVKSRPTCNQQYTNPPAELEVLEFVQEYLTDHSYNELPQNVREATLLYVELIHELENLI